MRNLLCNTLLLLLVVYISSCASSKKAFYFANQGSGELNSPNLAPASLIQSGDILSITVFSLSQESLSVYNTPNLTSGYSGTQSNTYTYSGPGSVNQLGGYLVSPDGYIKFPMLGKLKVAGLKKTELEEKITAAITERKLLIDPIITVRQVNFRVTVLGEVGRPTVINVPSEKISLLEAIGMAGDLTAFAKKDNVLLIREENNKKVTQRLNLNSTELFQSPYYYLQPNDVIYVEATKAKIDNTTRGRQALPLIFSGLSFGLILVEVITRKR